MYAVVSGCSRRKQRIRDGEVFAQLWHLRAANFHSHTGHFMARSVLPLDNDFLLSYSWNCSMFIISFGNS